MNLAIHDPDLLHQLLSSGLHPCWARRDIRPWMPPAIVECRPLAGSLVRLGHLNLLEIAPEHEGFFDVFRQRLRPGLALREVTLLFLADHTGSVVLTGERKVAEQARALDLPVWPGTSSEIDKWFPIRADTVPPLPTTAQLRVVLSNQFPSARQVPVCDEPVRIRKGSVPATDWCGLAGPARAMQPKERKTLCSRRMSQ